MGHELRIVGAFSDGGPECAKVFAIDAFPNDIGGHVREDGLHVVNCLTNHLECCGGFFALVGWHGTVHKNDGMDEER